VEPVDDVARRAAAHQAVPQIVSKPGSSSRSPEYRARAGLRASEVTRDFSFAALDLRDPTAKSAKVTRPGGEPCRRRRAARPCGHVHGESTEGLELCDRHLRDRRTRSPQSARRAWVRAWATNSRRFSPGKSEAHHQHHRGPCQADDRSEVLPPDRTGGLEQATLAATWCVVMRIV